MSEYSKRIESLDITIYDSITSQTIDEDKTSLLFVQRCLRRQGQYVYLEIGSYLGGTLQPHVVDSQCEMIYSIDKRPPAAPDERGRDSQYPDNCTQSMLRNLKEKFPLGNIDKIVAFDCDAKEIDPKRIEVKPNLCFIDGEHTNKAVYSDFQFCLKVCAQDAVIVFHDAHIIYKGIKNIKQSINRNNIRFEGFPLQGNVYVILFDKAIELFAEELKTISRGDEKEYFKESHAYILESKWDHSVAGRKDWLKRYVPVLFYMLRAVNRFFLRMIGRRFPDE